MISFASHLFQFNIIRFHVIIIL